MKIVRVEKQGRSEPIYDGGPKTLQLVKFDADLENNVKGDLPRGAISFLFFAKLDQNPDYVLDPGKRYIVSLRREGGVLRTWADATQLMLWVHSGSHQQEELPMEQGPETTIAYILLTPGKDADLAEFSPQWPRDGHPLYVYGRYKQLLLHPDPGVRDSACLAIAGQFWMRPKCLDEVARGANERTRNTAAELLKDAAQLPERLRLNPFFLTRQDWTEDALQTLDILADDARPEVHRQACALLRSLAPERAGANCK